MHSADLSEVFCQLVHYEQVQRESESWMQAREADYAAIMNRSTSPSIEMQHRQLERCRVCFFVFQWLYITKEEKLRKYYDRAF